LCSLPGARARDHSGVTSLALALVLVAAGAHASWNYLAKTAGGGATFPWLCAVCEATLMTAVGAAVLAGGERPQLGTALLFMVVSGALHAVYFVLLQRAYREGELSLVYPLARGTGPLLAAVVAIAALGERPGPVALIGAAVIVTAVISLADPRGLVGRRQVDEAVVYALLTGVCIGGYTLWDKQAVDAHDLSPIIYFWGGSITRAALLTPVALHRPAVARRTWELHRSKAVGVAVLSSIAYILVLYALRLAPVTYVAPAREVSVLIGAVLGVQLLSEQDARRRLVCAGAIVGGIAALAVG
jgi:drug/metabolite transporter (DMT)-like permease